MSFALPLVFLLLPLPLAAYYLLPPRRIGSGAVRLPPAVAATVRPETANGIRGRTLRWMPAVIWLLLIVALSGPREMRTLDVLPASGRDILLAIDLSGSMKKEDFDLGGERISRLDAVKQVAARFVRGRNGDRVGLIVFGDRAYVAAPMSHDVESVARAIETAVIGISGNSTAISDGLGLAMKRLRDSDAKSRVVILLSDGIDTTGTVAPVDAAAVAETLGIRIHTIALGPDDLESQPTSRDAVDSATLREIAVQSGGEMFRVRDTEALRAVAEAIDALEPSPSRAPPLRVWKDYWPWPAGAALVLAVFLLAVGRRAEV